MAAPLTVDVKTAAELMSCSVETIRRAIRTTGVDANGNPTFPPPLRAKRFGGKNQLRIKVSDLEAWHDSMEDA